MSPDERRKLERETRHLAERLLVGHMAHGVDYETALTDSWELADKFMATAQKRWDACVADAPHGKPAPTPLPSDGTPRMP